MGACVSKCYTFPPPNSSDHILHQKLVDLSDSPPPSSEPKEAFSSKSEITSSLSSLTSSSSSSPSPSPSDSSSSSSSSYSTQSSPGEEEQKPKESSGKASPEPKKHGSTKPKPSSKASGLPPKQPVTRRNQSLPAKRGRSSSPSSTTAGAGRKNTARNENSSVAPPPGRNSSSSPSSAAAAASAHRRSRSVDLQCQRRQHQGTARKENVRPPSPACSSTSRRSWSSEREATLPRNRQGQGSREITSSSQITSRFPLKEDMNNPLIAMDCFIFI